MMQWWCSAGEQRAMRFKGRRVCLPNRAQLLLLRKQKRKGKGETFDASLSLSLFGTMSSFYLFASH